MDTRKRSRLLRVLPHLGLLTGVLLISALILSMITIDREVDRLETRIAEERQSEQNENGKTDEIQDEEKMFRETEESFRESCCGINEEIFEFKEEKFTGMC